MNDSQPGRYLTHRQFTIQTSRGDKELQLVGYRARNNLSSFNF